MIRIEIETDNAAFIDNPNELGEILGSMAYQINGGITSGIARDSNGNRCGFYETIE